MVGIQPVSVCSVSTLPDFSTWSAFGHTQHMFSLSIGTWKFTARSIEASLPVLADCAIGASNEPAFNNEAAKIPAKRDSLFG